MALVVPHALTPGTNRNAAPVMANDVYLQDAVNDFHATWKTLLETPFQSGSALAAGTYILNANRNAATHSLVADSATTTLLSIPIISTGITDLAPLGYTTSYRIKVALVTAGVDPGAGTMTFGLYPFSMDSSSGNGSITLDTVVAGSTAVMTLAATQQVVVTGSAFAEPSGSVFTFGVVNSGVHAANSVCHGQIQLQYRNT